MLSALPRDKHEKRLAAHSRSAAAPVAGAYCYWRQQGAAGRLDIQTAEVKHGDVRRVVATSGTVSALVTVDIGSQRSGNIGAVNVDYSTR